MLFSLSFSAIYLLYAKLEENYGLARHAMAVYDRATKGVLPEEQYEVWSNKWYGTHYSKAPFAVMKCLKIPFKVLFAVM